MEDITIIGIFPITLYKVFKFNVLCGVEYVELGFRSFESETLEELRHILKKIF